MGDDSKSAAYIHMVHHMIEECIVLKMSKEESIEALSKHANINPLITATVWKELVKENKEFFEAYEMRLAASSSNNTTTTTTTNSNQLPQLPKPNNIHP